MGGRRADLVVGGLLVIGVLAFWAAFLADTADSVLTRVPLLDESWYLNDAARIRAEGWPGARPFVMSPGYTSLVAVAGAGPPGPDGVLPAHPAALLALQAVFWLACGLVPALVVWRFARRAQATPLAARMTAAAAGLLVLAYAPAAVYARTVLLDLPLTALVAAALALATLRERADWRALVAAAFLLGLAASLRGHVSLLGLPLAVLAWRRPAGRRGRVAATAIVTVLVLAPIVLASLHNTRLAGRPMGPSANLGVNLYLGQHPEAGGLFTSLAGFDQARDPSGEAFLERRLERELAGPAAADRLWLAEAWRLVRADPGGALVGWLRKIWLHAQAWEIAQITPLAYWRDEAPVLRALPVPWAALVVLGLSGLGLVVSGRGAAARALRRPALFWAAAVLVLVAVQSCFFVVTRYRLVLAPLLAVLAGAGLLVAVGDRGRLRWRLLAPWVAAVALLTPPWGLSAERELWRGLEAHNLARRLLAAAGDEPRPELRTRADSLLAAACAAAPRRAEPWRDRARNLAHLGRDVAALAVLADGTMQADDPAPLQWLRIGLVRESGRLDAAEALMVAYLRDHPADPDMLHDLAVLRGRRGRWRAAEETARRLREVAPRDARGWLDLAVAQTRLGRRDEAVATLEEGLAAVGDEAGRTLLRVNLGRLRDADGSR